MDGILAQSQGGALYYHFFASETDPDNILYLISYKHPDINVFLLKQEPLLYKTIAGNKKVILFIFQKSLNAVRCLLWKIIKLHVLLIFLRWFGIIIATIIICSHPIFPNKFLWLEHMFSSQSKHHHSLLKEKFIPISHIWNL